jgi:hypothetical protein
MRDNTNLNSTLQLRIRIFLQDGVVDGRLRQLVFVSDALRLLDDHRRYLAQAVAAQPVAPRRGARYNIKVNLGVRKGAFGEPRLPRLCHAATVSAAQRARSQQERWERVSKILLRGLKRASRGSLADERFVVRDCAEQLFSKKWISEAPPPLPPPPQ